MKKLITNLLLVGLIIGVTACGSSGSSSSGNASSGAAQSQSAASDEKSSDKEEQSDVAGDETNGSEDALKEFHQTLVDDENVIFEITSIEPDNIFGYTWKVYIENNTDKSLMFSISDAAVNGLMMDPFWATTVEPGKKKNDDISWGKTQLEENGISEITVIEAWIRIHDDEDWMADALVDTSVLVYPLGESAAKMEEHVPSGSDVVLFDTDECTMIITGYEPDGLFGYTMKAYLENKTDQTLMFSIDDASVNGYMMDPFWADEVRPGKRCNAEISWMRSSFEENGIEEVEEIEITVRVHDSDDFMGEYLINDTYTVEPK